MREIPGFLAFTLAYLLLFIKEQRLAYASLLVLALFTAITGHFAFFTGLLITTVISSIGFHYQAPIVESLSLQWLSKDRAPTVLGRMGAVREASGLLAMAFVAISWKWFGLPYWLIYWVGGSVTAAMVVYLIWRFPIFPQSTPQRQEIILRSRYWLYYALEFCGGARRQIFMVFAGWMLVERYGLKVHETTWILFATGIISMLMAPVAGWLIRKYGERPVLAFEYIAL